MRHYGETRLRNILSNLPGTCRQQMNEIERNGWTCAFYLGIYQGEMHYAMAASNGIEQRIVCSADIERLIARLFQKIQDIADTI